MNWLVWADLQRQILRSVGFTISLAWVALYAQSVPSPTPAEDSYVEGTIRDSTNSAITGVEVKFESGKTTESVFSDSKGYYKAKLPVGVYAMSASWGANEKYRRPQFRVAPSRIIILDVTFHADAPDCDPVFPRLAQPDGTPKTRAPIQDDYNDVCGGRDYLPITSSGHNLTLDLLIQYSTRRRSDGENTYVGYDARGPVLVAYNLFTLTADKAVYDVKNRTIVATGNVVTADGSGKTQHADSMRFRIENGETVPLP